MTNAAYRALALAVAVSIASMSLGVTTGRTALAQGSAAIACDATTTAANAITFACAIAAAGDPRRYRFVSRFSGVHDDSMASVIVLLDGEQIGCAPGSKPGISGEEGEATLECRLAFAGKAGTKRALEVQLWWSHAEYMGARLLAD